MKSDSTAPAHFAEQVSRRCRLLLADDQPFILEALSMLLRAEGYDVDTARSPAMVLESLAQREYDALLIDLNYTRDTTSGMEGLQLLDTVRQGSGLNSDRIPVIVMTAWASVDLAVAAMRRGANHFVQKPWENARLRSVLKAQLELHQAHRRTQMLAAENRMLRADGAPEFIATAPSRRFPSRTDGH